MKALTIEELRKLADTSGERYLEFLRQPSMSLGLYRLRAGEADPQQPHNQDEVYYVVSGKGKLRVEDKILGARPGAILFVAKHAEHKFIEIEEDLELLVFFAPAEES
jgi:mannose-6-phosphate isomerase-like protein (cupin superfamily)